MSEWEIFRDGGESHDEVPPHEGIAGVLGKPPPWRNFARSLDDRLGQTYRPGRQEVRMVNAALHLRRPLLVTGPPGSGKSSLAYAVARQLQLGPVLYWPINSRSALTDGLYTYDALGRLREAQLARFHGAAEPAEDVGRFIRLNALGTALYPKDRPRVLLIDEIDKSDIDLANDLLNVLEEGEFQIPELMQSTAEEVRVFTADVASTPDRVVVSGGRIRCREFPFIILTSNGERELAPAFLRRCLRLEIDVPTPKRLEAIVRAHLGNDAVEPSSKLISEFLQQLATDQTTLSVDQLLSAAYLVTQGQIPNDEDKKEVLAAVMQQLKRGG
jgi:MoxR-like ATPase